MDIWDLESRVSQVTLGSRETLEDLEMLPLEHGSHQAYRGSLDVLGLEVPSMELWDDHCGPNDGFGFCGGLSGFTPPKKWKDTDESSSSGIHCDETDVQKPADSQAPPNVTRVKSVDDYGSSPEGATKQRRYRKRTKHGRYATADDIEYERLPIDRTENKLKEECAFKRQTATSRSLNHIVRDDYDRGSVTNLFVCGRSEGSGTSSQEGQLERHGKGLGRKESVFPYGIVRERSSSCDELSPRGATVTASMRSTSQVMYVEGAPSSGNSNKKGGQHRRRRSSLFNAVSWLGKSSDPLTKSTESVNAYVPDDPSDLKGMTNVKVIAVKNYTAQGAHELSFKTGQKLKLKSPSMDGSYAFGWKRSSRFSGKKYGYFPLSHVQLYEK